MSSRNSPGTAALAHEWDFVAYHASACPTRTACVDLQTGERLSYGELDRHTAKCAGYLEAALGRKSGARVAVLARNCVDILVLHFGCIRAGAILQPLNWRLSGPELRALVHDGMPSLFIYQTEFVTQAVQAMEGVQIDRAIEMTSSENALARAIAAAEPAPQSSCDPDVPVTLLYTSGTTGQSKGVIVTGRNAWATALNFSMANEVAPRDVLLCDMPMFHVAGLFGVARSALFMGGTVLISDRFVPGTALARLSDPALAVTHFFAVPQMAAAMIQDPAYANADLTRLKALVIGGAPLPNVIVERLLNDGVMPIDGYGLSEAGTVFGMPLEREIIFRKIGTSGVPAMAIDVRLVDSAGRDVKDGEVGEIWLKGPSVTPGYWNQAEATANAFHDGWFKTGDAAQRDKDGFYRIADRWKDMYISGGENVYPAEIESVLAEHPGIAEAAVVGVADKRWGESGCAYVVMRPDATLAADQIIQHCRTKLAGYKIPRHVRFVEALPRGGSGKVKKNELRRDFIQTQ